MRKIRTATVSFLMEDSPHSVDFNLHRAKKYIEDAARNSADIVCLPETVTTNNVPNPEEEVQNSSEWARFFSHCAREFSIAVIAPFFTRTEDKVFNQATVYDSAGEEIGFYRKLQPTGSEARWVSPGCEFPILDLGFAKIGIMICLDLYFPEIARIYAMNGTEILFWPTTTHGPTQSGLEAQIRSRAIDHSLYVVESNLAGHPPYAPYAGRFYPGTARIIDFNGDIVSQTGRREGLAIYDIDLDERRQTSNVVLIHDPDDTRPDLEALTRMDLYAKQYSEIARQQKRYYDTL